MTYLEMEKMKAYNVIKNSSDKTFILGEIIWISENGDINSVQAAGAINPYEVGCKTLDFKVEVASDYEVIKANGSEICRRVK